MVKAITRITGSNIIICHEGLVLTAIYFSLFINRTIHVQNAIILEASLNSKGLPATL